MMKLVKKALLVASSLSLGLTLVGCSRSKVIDNSYIYNIEYTDKQYSNLSKLFEAEIKSYTLKGDRFLYITTKDSEVYLYDFIYDKVVFKTSEAVSSLYVYNGNTVMLITYDDGKNTKELRFTNGEVIVDRGDYITLNTYDITTESNKKEKDYKKLYFAVEKNTPGARDLMYYEVSFKGIRNTNKSIVLDNNPETYTTKKVNAEDVRKFKAGDEYIIDGDYYTNAYINDTYIFYNSSSNQVTGELYLGGTSNRKIITNSSTMKAIIQTTRQANSSKYDVKVGNSYYYLDTYFVDEKTGEYERVDNFKYYLIDSATSSLSSNLVVRGAYEIVDNMLVNKTNILINKSFKVVEDSTNKAFGTSYYDLGSGNYLTSYDSRTFIVNSNGDIKKAFNGSYTIVENGKAIAIKNGTKLTFIDFNGNYITDDVYAIGQYGSVERVDGNKLYYSNTKDEKNHLVTFKNGKITLDEEVDYIIKSYNTDITSVSMSLADNYYNNYDYQCYYRLTLNDRNTDGYYDEFKMNFYKNDGSVIGETDYAYASNYINYATDKLGDNCNYIILDKTDGITKSVSVYKIK